MVQVDEGNENPGQIVENREEESGVVGLLRALHRLGKVLLRWLAQSVNHISLFFGLYSVAHSSDMGLRVVISSNFSGARGSSLLMSGWLSLFLILQSAFTSASVMNRVKPHFSRLFCSLAESHSILLLKKCDTEKKRAPTNSPLAKM